MFKTFKIWDSLRYIIILSIGLFIVTINIPSNSIILPQTDNIKRIFTFWEPHQKIPGYLRLCIKTWKKVLPEYEIIILDYNNIKYYIEEPILSNILCKKMSLQIQSDAIRVAILKTFGGLWLDLDTILLNKQFLFGFNNYDLVMFGSQKEKQQHIGFIYSTKNCSIMNDWLEGITRNVKIYKKFLNNNRNINDSGLKNFFRKKYSWNYLGNGIIDLIVKNTTNKHFLRLDKYKMNIFPEIKNLDNISFNHRYKYNNFYFRKGDPKIIINESKGIILLHNSWTPNKFKKMSEKRFIKQDIILSKLFAQILEPNL